MEEEGRTGCASFETIFANVMEVEAEMTECKSGECYVSAG